jgi:hypothetical protein
MGLGPASMFDAVAVRLSSCLGPIYVPFIQGISNSGHQVLPLFKNAMAYTSLSPHLTISSFTSVNFW